MSWITESVSKAKKLKDHYRMHNIDIFIKDPLPKNVDVDYVLSFVSKRIPSFLMSNVDIIYIGYFDMFKEKQVNATYEDGAIYMTNEQSSNDDMIDDIIHEIAHSIEESHFELLYGDHSVKEEFIGKRRRLFNLLDSYDYEPPKELFMDHHYNEELDMYLFKDIGYEILWNLIIGLFPSPYAATSLREYYAVGFEGYFMKSKKTIKEICPALYSKLELLEYMEN
tara:strand:+ start:510 stop:1181 length:672 start_codon:yes stop_codon:yes gene_type:complete